MPVKPVEPEILDSADLYADWARSVPHIHSPEGRCLKNSTGPRCGTTGQATNAFRGQLS